MDIWKKESFVRKVLFLAILCALLAPLYKAQALRHASGGVTVTAKAGFRGFCKPDKWLPVHVTVENMGADVNARVQATYKNTVNGQTTVDTEVSLPATSRKEFFLYIKSENMMRGFTLSVLDGKNELAKTSLNISCSGDPNLLIGVLADTPSNYTVLNNIQPLTGGVQTAQLEIGDLPNLAQGWEMLDVLLVSNMDTGTLTPDQKEALELWLAGGGKLFVTGGIQWQPTAAELGDLLPLQPSATKKAVLSSLPAYALEADTVLEGETTLATGKLQAGANVLVEQDGIPLLVEKEIGFGKVYYFAADPALQPLSDWGGMKKIYEHLLAFKSPKPSWVDGPWDNYQASNALAALPELSLPSFVYICCWLGLYIVIIGPVNYFVLRRAKRTELAWVTVPVLVVIFTCLAYFWGYAYRGTKPILNRIMLAQGWQGVAKTHNTALVGVYSPNRTSYDIESQEQFLPSPYPTISEDLQGSGNWLSTKTDTGAVIPGVRVEIGGMKSLETDGYLPSAISIQHDLAYILSDKTPAIQGSITNTSGLTLKDVVIITSSGWWVLGELAPGKSKTVSLILSDPNSARLSRYTLISDLGWDTYTFDNVEEKRRSSFFQAVTYSYNDSFSPNVGVYLMAWVDEKIPTPVTLRDRETNVTDTLFYIEKLTPALETKPGKLTLNSSIYGWESSLGAAVLTSSYNLPAGGYNIHFRPTLRVPIQFNNVDSLNLVVGTGNAPQQVHPSIWNYQTETWLPLTLNNYGSVDIPQASQYMGIGGDILINIQGDQNSYFDITSVDFTMTVQP